MTDFDDLKYKSQLDRLTIRIKQLHKETVNTWKLTDLLSCFASCYYKNDLLHSIIKSINEGVNPNDIVIFDKTINYSVLDYNFRELSYYDDIIAIFKLGTPISIFPNSKIIEISYLLRFFRNIKDLFSDIEKHVIIKNQPKMGLYKLQKMHNLYIEQGFEITINKLETDAISSLPDGASFYVEIIKNYKKKMNQDYSRYFNNKNTINKLTKKLKNNSDDIDLKNFGIYYTEFYRVFERINRPIVAIYNYERNTYNFLCSYHFNSVNKESLLMVIDEITHNSPYQILLTMAGWIISPVISKYINNDKKKKHDEKYLKELEIQEKVENNLNKLYIKLEESYNLNFKKEIKRIECEFISNKLDSLLNTVTDTFNKTLTTYKFDIVEIK